MEAPLEIYLKIAQLWSHFVQTFSASRISKNIAQRIFKILEYIFNVRYFLNTLDLKNPA